MQLDKNTTELANFILGIRNTISIRTIILDSPMYQKILYKADLLLTL